MDRLVDLGADHIRVVDDLSSGELANIQGHVDSGRVEVMQLDLRVAGAAEESVAAIDTVFTSPPFTAAAAMSIFTRPSALRTLHLTEC